MKPGENPINVEEIFIPLDKIDETLSKLRISKLLNDPSVSKLVTKNWVEVNNLSSGPYSTNKNISFKTLMLRSNLCDYSDAYLVVKWTTHLLAANENDKAEKNVSFKKNDPFRLCISKINSTLTNNARFWYSHADV